MHALPVYEIYKVGEDLHWQNGLNFFSDFGLSLIFIPHWNNNDGGDALDTSHCYVGTDRYDELIAMLEGEHITGDFAQLRGDAHGDDHREHTVVGIDENTALIIDPAAAECRVMGPGGVTIVRGGSETHFPNGDAFAASELGDFRLPEGDDHYPQRRPGSARATASPRPRPSASKQPKRRMKCWRWSSSGKRPVPRKIMPARTSCATRSRRWAGR